MSIKRLNLLKRFALENNLDLLETGTDGTRWFAEVQAQNGAKSRFTLPKKEGDIRGDLNEQSRIKRFAQNNVATMTLPSVPAASENDVQVTVRRKLAIVMAATGEPPAQPPAAPPPATAMERGPVPEGVDSVLDKKEPVRRLRRLTQAQFYALIKLLEQIDTMKFYSHDDLAKHCSKELGIEIAETSTKDACKLLGKTTQYQHNRLQPGPKPHEHTAIVARCLVQLFEHLGEAVPNELKELV